MHHYTDIAECSDGTNSCEQLCNNRQGSYECSCLEGYELDSDGFSCRGILYYHTARNPYTYYVQTAFTYLDIDECLSGTNLCAETCVNTNGSYACGCRAGYQLSRDGLLCDGQYILLL